jgi:hypothetical protein
MSGLASGARLKPVLTQYLIRHFGCGHSLSSRKSFICGRAKYSKRWIKARAVGSRESGVGSRESGIGNHSPLPTPHSRPPFIAAAIAS